MEHFLACFCSCLLTHLCSDASVKLEERNVCLPVLSGSEL